MPQRGRGEIVKQDLKDKNVLVVGAGKSGIGSVGLLLNIGARPILYDGNEKLDEAEVRASLPKGAEVPIVLGTLSDEQLGKLDLCVMSPGVPTDIPPSWRTDVQKGLSWPSRGQTEKRRPSRFSGKL